MEPRVKSINVAAEVKADAPEGRAVAAVVKFGTVDLDGDVVLQSAWPAGTVVAIQPAHDWNAPPLGEGTTAQAGEWGTVHLDFFLKTSLGRDWYEAVKARGPRQQWSFGYRVLESEPGTVAGQPVQMLKRLDIFEASPVLLGSQPLSHTMSIKGLGLSFDDHADQVRDALIELVERARSGSDLRLKEGRPISAARRTRIAAARDDLHRLADELAALLAETEPRTDAPKSASDLLVLPEWARFVDEFRATQAFYGLAPITGENES